MLNFKLVQLGSYLSHSEFSIEFEITHSQFSKITCFKEKLEKSPKLTSKLTKILWHKLGRFGLVGWLVGTFCSSTYVDPIPSLSLPLPSLSPHVSLPRTYFLI